MQGIVFQFDARQVAPQLGFEPWEAGWYKLVIEKTNLKAARDPNNGFLECAVKCIEGPKMGQVSFMRFNIRNSNVQAVEIAQKQLSALCHVTNVYNVAAQDIVDNAAPMLHGIPFWAHCTIQEQKDNDGKPTGQKSNNWNMWKDVNGNAPGKAGGGPMIAGGQPQGGGAGQPGGFQPQGGQPGGFQPGTGGAGPGPGAAVGSPQPQGQSGWGGQPQGGQGGGQPASGPQYNAGQAGQGGAWGQPGQQGGQPQGGQPQGGAPQGGQPQGGGWGGPQNNAGNAGGPPPGNTWQQNAPGNGAPQGGAAPWGNRG
jgi:hypothetical protein